MYQPVKIANLSENQKRKLIKGEPVRVQCGNGNTIYLSKQQMKKLINANKKGKKSTIIFDPYQSQQHGEGLGDLLKKGKQMYEKYKDNPIIKPIISKIKSNVKDNIKVVVDDLANRSKKYIPGKIADTIAQEINKKSDEIIGNGKMKKGCGLIGNVGSMIASRYGPIASIVAENIGSRLDKKLGTGILKNSKKKKSKKMIGRALMPAGY